MTSCGQLPERFVQMHAMVAIGVVNAVIGAVLVKSEFFVLKLSHSLAACLSRQRPVHLLTDSSKMRLQEAHLKSWL